MSRRRSPGDDREQRAAMATATTEPPEVMGGFVAMAESAWMGAALSTELLEPLHEPHDPLTAERRRGLSRLLLHEFTIPQATVLLAASFFFSAALGAIRQVLFNAEFGAGSEASAYYAAFRLPDTLFSLIAGGALSSAMIPVLLSTLHEDGKEAAQRLTNLVLTSILAVFAVLCFLGVLLAPVFVNNLLAPGFDDQTSELTAKLTRIMMIQPLVLAIGSVATAVLNSRNQFLLTALSVLSHNIGLIGGIIATGAYPELGIYGPTLGVIFGVVLQVGILLPGLFGDGARPRLVWDLHDARLGEIIHLLIPNGLAVGVGYAGFIIDTSFASRADEIEALPAIHNAWLLVGLPISLLGQAIGQAAFPRLAGHAALREWRELKRTLALAIGAVLAMSVPAVLGLIGLGRRVISTIFEQGKFDAVAGDLTYDVLVIYALALPAYVTTEVITRGLISLRDTRTPLFTNTVQLICRTTLMAALVGSQGVIAVPLALAITASIETVALGLILIGKVRRVTEEPVSV
jgi:putative peptidoglycan lipid II flippase